MQEDICGSREKTRSLPNQMSSTNPQDLLAKRHLKRIRVPQKNWDLYDIEYHKKKCWRWLDHVLSMPPPPTHWPGLVFVGHPRENGTEAGQRKLGHELSSKALSMKQYIDNTSSSCWQSQMGISLRRLKHQAAQRGLSEWASLYSRHSGE